MKKKGFSLVELMVTLVVVAVLFASLAPVITKRLKSKEITIAQGANTQGEITNSCSDNSNFGSSCQLCTPQYCIICGLEKCTDGQYLDSKKCECKTCSDKFSSKCSTCEQDKCTMCSDSSYYINNGYCTPCPDGSFCDGKNLYATCPNTAGYYCDSNGIHKCKDTYGSNCASCNASACTSCEWGYFVSGGSCASCNMTACGRCTSTSICTACNGDWVLEGNKCSRTCSAAMSNCLLCNGSSSYCATCMGGYFRNASGTCSSCSAANCLKCVDDTSSVTCSQCKAGYYLSGGSCQACSSKFGSNCAVCDSSQCLACVPTYHVEDSTQNPACESDNNEFNCSDSNFMTVGSFCMTRKNMGDSVVLPIPSTVTVVEAGGSDICYSQSQKCCWKGTTASGYNSENGGYSGQNRTVCNWEAANEICSKFNYAGKTWRLPSESELSILANGYSIGLGANGLMLCDYSAGYSSARCTNGWGLCKGSYDGGCRPNYLWSGTLSGSFYAQRYSLNSGAWTAGTAVLSDAFSVRCVVSE